MVFGLLQPWTWLHTPTSQHRVMHIYYYLLLFSSAFHFTLKNISINQQQWHCKCMHNKTASHSLTWSFSVTEHLTLTSVGNVSLLRCKITTTVLMGPGLARSASVLTHTRPDLAIPSLGKWKLCQQYHVCTINSIIRICSSQLEDRWK